MESTGWATMPHETSPKLEKLANLIPDRVRRVLFRTDLYQTLRRFSPVLLIEVHDRFPHDRVEARKTLPLLFDIGYSVYSLEDDPELKFPLRTPKAWSGEKHCVATRTVPR